MRYEDKTRNKIDQDWTWDNSMYLTDWMILHFHGQNYKYATKNTELEIRILGFPFSYVQSLAFYLL